MDCRFISSHRPPVPSLTPVGWNNSGKCCIHKKDGSPNYQEQSGGQQFTDALGGGWNGELPTFPAHLLNNERQRKTKKTRSELEKEKERFKKNLNNRNAEFCNAHSHHRLRQLQPLPLSDTQHLQRWTSQWPRLQGRSVLHQLMLLNIPTLFIHPFTTHKGGPLRK